MPERGAEGGGSKRAGERRHHCSSWRVHAPALHGAGASGCLQLASRLGLACLCFWIGSWLVGWRVAPVAARCVENCLMQRWRRVMRYFSFFAERKFGPNSGEIYSSACTRRCHVLSSASFPPGFCVSALPSPRRHARAKNAMGL
jgi:hypothetical protein